MLPVEPQWRYYLQLDEAIAVLGSIDDRMSVESSTVGGGEGGLRYRGHGGRARPAELVS